MRKVAICGTSGTLREAPFNDASFEFWILNDMFKIVKGFHRIFEMHPAEYLKETVYEDGQTKFETLQNIQVPVYMQKKHREIQNSVEYPLSLITKTFGRKYFRSTVDYMIALAIVEGFDEIHIYGVDMAFDTEYGEQRPSCEYWLGVAEGKGVKVILPSGCDLLKTYHLYGYDYYVNNDFQIKAKSKIAELDRQAKEFQKNYYITQGAKDTWEFVLREIK